MRWGTIVLLVCAPASAQCLIEGNVQNLEAEVHTPGVEPFSVEVERADIRAALPEGDTTAIPVRIAGALHFDAEVKTFRIPFAFDRRLDIHGVLRLPGGVPHWSVRRITRRGADVVLSMEDREVHIPRVIVPCDALRIGQAQVSDLAGRAYLTPRSWAPSIARLDVFQEPGTSPLQIHPIRPSDFELHEVERRGEWVRVIHRFEGGSLLDGWVRRATLRPWRPHPMLGSRWPRSATTVVPVRGGDVFTGPAILRRGAPVHVSAGGAEWAQAYFDGHATVEWVRGERWASLLHGPGAQVLLSATPRALAWVRVEDLTLNAAHYGGVSFCGAPPFEPPATPVVCAVGETPRGLAIGDRVVAIEQRSPPDFGCGAPPCQLPVRRTSMIHAAPLTLWQALWGLGWDSRSPGSERPLPSIEIERRGARRSIVWIDPGVGVREFSLQTPGIELVGETEHTTCSIELSDDVQHATD